MTPGQRAVLGWVALALAGLAIAVGVTYAATRLVGQHVALSGEPRVGDQALVAPPRTTTQARPPVRTVTVPPPATATVPPAATTPEEREPGRPPEGSEHESEPDGDDD